MVGINYDEVGELKWGDLEYSNDETSEFGAKMLQNLNLAHFPNFSHG